VPLNRAFIGRSYPAPGTYEVSREKIRDFAVAIGDPQPAYVDPEAARALGHADVIAPPTFLTTLGFRFPTASPIADPELGLNYALVVHGEQHYTHHRPVRAGDVLTVTTRVDDIRDAGRNELMVLVAEISTADGERVADARSTVVSRGTAAPPPAPAAADPSDGAEA